MQTYAFIVLLHILKTAVYHLLTGYIFTLTLSAHSQRQSNVVATKLSAPLPSIILEKLIKYNQRHKVFQSYHHYLTLMAPQTGGPPGFPSGDDGPFGQDFNPNNVIPPADSTNSSRFNVPMLALGLALAAFLLVCLSVCLCTYRRAKSRNRNTSNLGPSEMERGNYVGLGLGLDDQSSPIAVVKYEDKETAPINGEEVPPPAYTPKQSPRLTRSVRSPSLSSTINAPNSEPNTYLSLDLSPSPLLSLSPSPALAPAPTPPALSSYSLSPPLYQGENVGASLLGSTSRPLTPPPPMYVR